MCIGVDVQIASQEEGPTIFLFNIVPRLVKGSVQQIEKYIKISATHRLSIDHNKQFFFFFFPIQPFICVLGEMEDWFFRF